MSLCLICICGTFFSFVKSAVDELYFGRVLLSTAADTDVNDLAIMLLEINQLNNRITHTVFITFCVLNKGYKWQINTINILYHRLTPQASCIIYVFLFEHNTAYVRITANPLYVSSFENTYKLLMYNTNLFYCL